jgi:hypothetical protein
MKKALFFLSFFTVLLVSNSAKAQTSSPLVASCTTSESFTVTVCDSLLSPSGKTWDTTGIYLDTILNTASCDSIMFFNLTVTKSTSKTFNVSTCDSIVSPTGKVWNSTGTYYDTVPNLGGCDSLLTYNLTVGQQILDTIVQMSCDSFVSYTGKTWMATGVFHDTIVNLAACDTIMIYDLTIVNPTTASVYVSVCDSLISPTGKVWSSTGVYIDTIANSNSCDSIITFNLTVGTQILDTIVTYACDSLISPSGKKWITTGIYSDTVINALACDSIFVFDLQIGGMLISLTDTVCDSTLSPTGNFMYSSTGVYQDTLFSSLGCDSIVYTYNLQVNSTNHDTVVVFACDTVKSTSTNNMWTTTGIYNDTIFTNQYGCDSNIVYNVTIGKTVTSLSSTVCYSYLSPAGNTYTQTGIYYDTLQSVASCDSIFVINLIVNTADTTVNEYQGTLIAYTSGASYKWLDCNNGLAPVAGATNQQFSPTVIGSYALELTKYGCVDTSSCYTVNSLAGINESSFGANFNVYPNPTSDNFIINFGETLNTASVTIVDITGKTILTKNVIHVNSTLVSIAAIDNGTYFVKIKSNNSVKTISVVKQ